MKRLSLSKLKNLQNMNLVNLGRKEESIAAQVQNQEANENLTARRNDMTDQILPIVEDQDIIDGHEADHPARARHLHLTESD